NIIYGWIARFGCFSVITTDQGRQFESKLFFELTKMIGTNRIELQPFILNPLKAAIKTFETSSWTSVLPSVLLGIRTALKVDLNASSAELANNTFNFSYDENALTKFKTAMASLKPCNSRTRVEQKIFVYPHLSQ
ncbi:pol polyprotein-like protein, partial [Leptotrombidium deliense]